MRIAKLKVQNFKAFYGDPNKPYEFDFTDKYGNAQNILLYGENGSGKSSLYWTLYHALSTADAGVFKKYKNIFAKRKEKEIRLLEKLKKREYSSIIDLTNFYFSPKEPYKMPIIIEIGFDNGKKFIYDENAGITVDPDVQEEFDRLTKIKTFLTYRSLYFVNELFGKKLFLEHYIEALSLVYGKEIRTMLNEYYDTQKSFWKEYHETSRSVDTLLSEFSKQFKLSSLAKEYISEIEEDAEFEWCTAEGGKIYKNVKYFSADATASIHGLAMEISAIDTIFDFDNFILAELETELDKIIPKVDERSEIEYWSMLTEEKFATLDADVIDSIDLVENIKEYLSSLFLLSDNLGDIGKLIGEINDSIKEKIAKQMLDINTILSKYYKNNITVEDIIYDELGVSLKDDFDRYSTKFKIKSTEVSIPHNHIKFLNEAKLSSINLAFYISIIKSYAELRELKLLVLDDLLISLDMSNRDIVLDILQEYFSDYQIIFLTHDRAFFEMAKQKFDIASEHPWSFFEMYINDEGDFEKPYLQKSLNYFEKAEKHFREYDYSACANYLRKEVERIKKLKTKEERVGVPVNRSIRIIKALIDSDDFTNFANPKTTDHACIGRVRGKLIGVKSNLDQAREPTIEIDLKDIASILQRILHPQSHDDTSRPLYKKELEEAIAVIQEVRNTISQEGQ